MQQQGYTPQQQMAYAPQPLAAPRYAQQQQVPYAQQVAYAPQQQQMAYAPQQQMAYTPQQMAYAPQQLQMAYAPQQQQQMAYTPQQQMAYAPQQQQMAYAPQQQQMAYAPRQQSYTRQLSYTNILQAPRNNTVLPYQMASPMMNPPGAQMMVADNNTLLATSGLVVRQVAQYLEMALQIVGIPWESQNKYNVSALPTGRVAAREHDQPGSWQPSGEELEALPELMRVQEESDCCTRCCMTWMGCGNMRPLTLHYSQYAQEVYRSERPCNLGGWICCPSEMTMKTTRGQVLGMSLEDYDSYCGKCCESCCCCTSYVKVLEAAPAGMQHKYTLRTSTCCCGRVNNWCGASCCKNNLLIDILDPNLKLLSTIQQTYAPSKGCSALCRCFGSFNNYIMEWPPGATAAQRALLLNALFHVEYFSFEPTGDDDSGGGTDCSF